MTNHRRLVLDALAVVDERERCYPPHSVSTLIYIIDSGAVPGWEPQALTKQQVGRTLNRLWAEGWVVVSREKCEPVGHAGLPYWERLFEPSAGAMERYREDRLRRLVSQVRSDIQGETKNFFGESTFFPPEITPTKARKHWAEIDSLLVGGDDPRLKQCRQWLDEWARTQ